MKPVLESLKQMIDYYTDVGLVVPVFSDHIPAVFLLLDIATPAAHIHKNDQGLRLCGSPHPLSKKKGNMVVFPSRRSWKKWSASGAGSKGTPTAATWTPLS